MDTRHIQGAFLTGLDICFGFDQCLHMCPTVIEYSSPNPISKVPSPVDDCLKESSVGDCSTGKFGPIGERDVSLVNDMGTMFLKAKSFNSDTYFKVRRVESDRYVEDALCCLLVQQLGSKTQYPVTPGQNPSGVLPSVKTQQ